MRTDPATCPLCGHHAIESFFEDANRHYLRCSHCELIFVPQNDWVTKEAEKATYDLHNNSAEDQGYRQFLSRLTIPLLEKLPPQQLGLDFGCGPGPALPAMLEEHGHQVVLFDRHYQNNPTVLNRPYDFICATEVVEHLHNPNKEFTRLFSILKPEGWLGIMTKLATDKSAFSRWHYIRDLTHICFYSHKSFEYLAQRFNAELIFVANDALLLRKKR